MIWVVRFFLLAFSCLFFVFHVDTSIAAWWWDDLTSDSFFINVWDFTPGDNSLVQGTAEETIDATLGTVIKSLMIVFWSIALLIMTIGAWYMILYHGNDELLSRWKTIFKAWILGLILALSSYYIVDFVRYILYTN